MSSESLLVNRSITREHIFEIYDKCMRDFYNEENPEERFILLMIWFSFVFFCAENIFRHWLFFPSPLQHSKNST